ncbi:MAG: GAF domain-containing protein [Deltaproteobacteria bacterium]|nr:GAF domain-containing protein [Deltaproteobacteria bacterium]
MRKDTDWRAVVVLQEGTVVGEASGDWPDATGPRSGQRFAQYLEDVLGVPSPAWPPGGGSGTAGAWRVGGELLRWTRWGEGPLVLVEAVPASRSVAAQQEVIGQVLRAALEAHSLERYLQRVLGLVLGLSWLNIERKGTVMLTEGDHLRLVVSEGVSPALCAACSTVQLGQCLCGKAALGREPVVATHLDSAHDILPAGTADHGHITVPILHRGELLGVFNTYTAAGYQPRPEDVRFLEAVADAVAGVILRYREEEVRMGMERELLVLQKREAIAAVAGGVAHDFNNLISVVRSCAEELAVGLGPQHALGREVEDILRASASATELARQLLSLGRAAESRHDADLSLVVSGMARVLRHLVGEGITLQVALDPDLSVRTALSCGQVEQILLNLVTNAADALEGSGQIQISLRVEGGAVALIVADDGPGIAPEVLPRIFEPFFSTKGAAQGSGVGLHSVRELVRAAGGEVAVQTEVGKGTALRVTVPLRS